MVAFRLKPFEKAITWLNKQASHEDLHVKITVMKKTTDSANPLTVKQTSPGHKPKAGNKQSKATKLPRRGFLYQVHYCPNPDCIQIHTRTRFPECDVYGLTLRTTIKNAGKPGWGIKRKFHSFYKDLAKIHGLKSASDTDGYTLQCLKVNNLFNWEEILPKILKAIKVHVAKKRVMVEAGAPIHPSARELAELSRDSLLGL